jgi:YegS/Rv2252/BmrU family lipid kinase
VPGELHAIVNPVSGAGRTRRRWPELATKLEAIGWRVRSYVTTAPGDATGVARRLLSAGARELLSVGGDGTANEVVNGFFREGHAMAGDAILSVMPTGTGHDFARSLGIAGIGEAIAALAAGRICRIDVGLAEYRTDGGCARRCFVNAADAGVGAVAAARINRSRKLLGGRLTYLVGAARAILTYQPRPARVVVDGTTISDEPMEMVLVANGRFHAGGMRMAPMACMADGLFEVFVLRRIPKLSLLLSLLPRAYRGAHVSHPAVHHVRGRDVQVQAAGLPLETDGEQPGTADLRIRVLPQALRVRVPARAGCP